MDADLTDYGSPRSATMIRSDTRPANEGKGIGLKGDLSSGLGCMFLSVRCVLLTAGLLFRVRNVWEIALIREIPKNFLRVS